MERLDGKVILVAGAGGIGSGLAHRYAAEGARVVIGDVNLPASQEAVEAVLKAGGEATAVLLDGTDEQSVAAAVATCVSKYGGLDGLHANFAYFGDTNPELGILELPLTIFDETQRVNSRGFYLCTRAALPAMLERGGGSIIYTSSVAAYMAGASQVAYAMSKAAGQALMRHVASRYGPMGVRANSLAPAMTLHARLEKELPTEFIEWAKGNASIKSRVGRPDDIAAMGALLMSDEGSYITGQVICIDGGTTMRA